MIPNYTNAVKWNAFLQILWSEWDRASPMVRDGIRLQTAILDEYFDFDGYVKASDTIPSASAFYKVETLAAFISMDSLLSEQNEFAAPISLKPSLCI